MVGNKCATVRNLHGRRDGELRRDGQKIESTNQDNAGEGRKAGGLLLREMEESKGGQENERQEWKIS